MEHLIRPEESFQRVKLGAELPQGLRQYLQNQNLKLLIVLQELLRQKIGSILLATLAIQNNR